jgi:two-component system cell cycle response regulator DivK
VNTRLHDDGRIASRILLVEPDDDTRGLHGQLLQQIGCEVVEAFDSRDALVKALTYKPALVMTEIHLPFFDGHALCELLRRDSTMRSVPILVVTTEKDRAQLERARAAGADACLVKPATLDALFNQIRHLLARSSESHRTRAERPPSLVCPSCDRPLWYYRSHIGGVKSRKAEQWDEFVCPHPGSCGVFEFRQRTRKLRRIC